jgi:polysaccharide biosynthesis transport protein
MKRRPATDLGDYWEIFLRRRWWVVVPAVLIALGTLALVSKLPKVYRSETLILVEPQKVPADFVKPTVTTDVNDRLQIISQEILSRTHLQHIIDEFSLYRNESRIDRILTTWFHTGKPTQEEIVDAMRKDITVETIAEEQDRQHTLGAFKIYYQGKDPAQVQQITREIASLFIEENVKVREQQAEGTSHFIDDELEKARQALNDQEARIRDFKASHMGSLPEQESANLQLLGQYQTSLQVNGEALARAQEQKTYLESLLSVVSPRNADPLSPAQPQIQSQLQAELEDRRAQLRMAEKKYKPQHPDVIRLKDEVGVLEKLLTDDARKAPAAAPANTPAPPASADLATTQIHSQIAGLVAEIKRRTDQQAQTEKQIKQMQSRVEVLPTVEQQLSELDRDYQISKLNYASLLEKKNASGMAAEMERRAEGEQFRVLDPANLPEKPYKPNVGQLSLLGVLGGILGGCALGMLMEFKDKSINSAQDATFYLRLPALGSLPLLDNSAAEKDAARRRARGRDGSLGLDLAPEGRVRLPRTLTVKPDDGPDGAIEQSGPAPELIPSPIPSIEWHPFPEHLVVAHNQSDGNGDAYAKEQFRMIRTRLIELRRTRSIRTLMVTSALQGEGKTWVSTNLAFSMSRFPGLRVLLVDADLKKAGVGSFLKLSSEVGLSSYLLNGKTLGGVRLQLSPNLAVVPTPRLEEDSAELLSGKRMHDFLDEALQAHDLVIVDTPPVLALSDAQVLTGLVDAAILVVRAGSGSYDLARSAIELLKPKIIGVVVNGVRHLAGKSYHYGYYPKVGKSH